MTLDEGIALWKTQNPFPIVICPDGVCRNTTQSEYDGMAADRGQFLVDQAAMRDAEESRIALRKKYRAAKTITSTPVGTTAAEVRQAVIQHRTILDGLLEVLKDAQIVLDD